MSQVASQPLYQKLQNIRREWLFLILILCATIPLFTPIPLPNQPNEASEDFFANLMALKPGDRILLASDWTNSTRAESGAECEALLRILIRKGVKIVMYSSGDAQAPQVFRDTMGDIAEKESKAGRPLYQPFQDYIVAGFFPNAEGTALGINNNFNATFSGRKDTPPHGSPTDIMTSPVLQGVKSVSDFKYLIMITASNTERITFEGVKKTPLMFMVTGVMAPEDNVYYASGQLKGLIGGVKGVFDLEQLMQSGINTPKGFKLPKFGVIDGFTGMENEGRGTHYYLPLQSCLLLLIVSIFIGNVGVWLGKRHGGKS